MLLRKLISPPISEKSRFTNPAGTLWYDAKLTNWARRTLKKTSMPMKTASARSCVKVAKAASISRLVLALSTWICNPMARAADCRSLNVVSVSTALTGLTSTAIRAAWGTITRNSSSRFAVNSPLKRLTPVRLPPGRARLETRPSLTGSCGDENDGDRRACSLGRLRAIRRRGDHGDLPANQFGRQRWQSLHLILSPAVFDRDVLVLDIAGILEALAKSAQTLGRPVRRCRVEEPNNRQRALLRASRGRPRSRRTAKQRDDLAAFQKLHSGLLRTMGQHTGLASIRSGVCCAARFRPGLLPLRVNRVDSDRSRMSVFVRNAPKSGLWRAAAPNASTMWQRYLGGLPRLSRRRSARCGGARVLWSRLGTSQRTFAFVIKSSTTAAIE